MATPVTEIMVVYGMISYFLHPQDSVCQSGQISWVSKWSSVLTLKDLSLIMVSFILISIAFSRNCGLAEKIVGRPVPALDNPLAPQPAQSFVELREHVIPMLLALGPSMHYDPVLMYKVLRLAKAALTKVLICGV
jgi:hypothetical protein